MTDDSGVAAKLSRRMRVTEIHLLEDISSQHRQLEAPLYMMACTLWYTYSARIISFISVFCTVFY